MGIAEGVRLGEFSEHSSWHAQVNPNGEDVPASVATTGANDQLLRRETGGEGLDDGIRYGTPRVHNRPTADLDHLRVWEHAEDRYFRRLLYVLVKQALSHQHGVNMVTLIFGHDFDHSCAPLSQCK